MRFIGVILIMLATGLASPALAVKVEIGDSTSNGQSSADSTTQTAKAPLPLSVVYQAISENPKIGEPFILQVKMNIDQGVVLEPITYKEQLGDWDVLKVEKGEVNCNEQGCQRLDTLTLVAYMPGQVEVPTIPFGFSTKDKQGEYRPLPITIKVDGLPPKVDDEPGKIRGLKSPQGMISWWLVGIIVISVLVLGAGLWWWLKKKGLIKSLIKSAPMIPPEVTAIERLNKLKTGQLLDQDQDKLYYSTLTDILRRYLEARYTIHALDRTTHELAKNLKQTNCQRVDIIKITDLMEFSDLVKFAKAGADQREADGHWQLVWDFVEKTTPKIEEADVYPSSLEDALNKSS